MQQDARYGMHMPENKKKSTFLHVPPKKHETTSDLDLRTMFLMVYEIM